ncbi:MAG: HAMP domain-containing protein [Chloroflexi bacterium]|nr:MAG: HAMP domain-containing protein [Chloroflexota bacterium]
MPDFYQRIWGYVGAVSVRTKILGIVLGLVILLGVGITIQVRQVMFNALVARLQEQSIANGRDLAARATDLILINDLYALHELLNETQLNNPDVQYAFIVDADGDIIAHTFGDGFPLGLLGENQIESAIHHQTVSLDTDLGRVWDTAVPIFEGQAGMARIGMSENSIHDALDSLTRQMLLTTVAVSAVGILAAVLLTWIVTRPILQLKEAAKSVGEGDFSQRVRPWAGDEIGELALAFNVMTDQLAHAEIERAEREKLRKLLLEKVITAQEEERQRISRELHDETGSALTSLMVRLQMMSQQCPVPALKPQMNDLRQLLKRTLDDVHNLAVELRPSVLDDLGLEAALKRYVHDFCTHHHLDVDLVVVGLDQKRLPSPVETALYRIVQEGLTNAVRHAHAQTVSVLVERRNGRVRAFIEDDGTGFDLIQAKASGRLGLYGMQERTELLGGHFVIESEYGNGTSILIEVPA